MYLLLTLGYVSIDRFSCFSIAQRQLQQGPEEAFTYQMNYQIMPSEVLQKLVQTYTT